MIEFMLQLFIWILLALGILVVFTGLVLFIMLVIGTVLELRDKKEDK